MTTYPDRGSGKYSVPTRSIRIVLVLFAIAALQMGFAKALVAPYDEGLVLYGAARVAGGGTPYLDFWSMYGPGSFYALAGLDRVFGESVLTGRAFDAAVRACVVVLMFLLVRRHAGRVVALGCAATAFCLLVGLRQYLFPALPASACILLALLALSRVLQNFPRPRDWFLPGAAAGLTLLFRHDFGLCVIAACLWVMWCRDEGVARIGSSAGALATFAAGLFVVAGPLYGWLIFAVPGSTLFSNLVSIPLEVYAQNRSLPFPNPMEVARQAYAHSGGVRLADFVVFAPPLVSLVGIARVATYRWRRQPFAALPDLPSRRLFEATLIVLILLTIKGSVRVQVLHMMPALLLSLVLVGLMLFKYREIGPFAWRLSVAAVIAAGALAIVGTLWRIDAIPSSGDTFPTLAIAKLIHCDSTEVVRLGCFAIEPDLLSVLQYLGTHARPGDGLYVGAGRHDKLVVSNVELYFLSGLPAATRWADTHPGVQTTARVQRLMIAEMQRRPPAFVVLNTTWDNVEEPNASRLSSGVTLLDDYLSEHYRSVFHAGKLSVGVPRAAGPS